MESCFILVPPHWSSLQQTKPKQMFQRSKDSSTLSIRSSWAAEGGEGAWNLRKLPGATTIQIHRPLLPTSFHIRKPQSRYFKPYMLTAANSIQMLLRNLDCDGTPLHAPLLPSAAHELLLASVHLLLEYASCVWDPHQQCLDGITPILEIWLACRTILDLLIIFLFEWQFSYGHWKFSPCISYGEAMYTCCYELFINLCQTAHIYSLPR